MKSQVQRATVDLSAYPDLVIIYLGMRVNALRGLLTIAGLGPQIMAAGQAKPEGLLHCEQNIIYSIFPFQIWNALVLERFRNHGSVDTLPTTSRWVAAIHRELRGHRLLARNLLYAWGH